MALIYEGSITTNMNIIKGFNKYDELMNCFDGFIFNEVPKNLIDELYNWLRNK